MLWIAYIYRLPHRIQQIISTAATRVLWAREETTGDILICGAQTQLSPGRHCENTQSAWTNVNTVLFELCDPLFLLNTYGWTHFSCSMRCRECERGVKSVAQFISIYSPFRNSRWIIAGYKNSNLILSFFNGVKGMRSGPGVWYRAFQAKITALWPTSPWPTSRRKSVRSGQMSNWGQLVAFRVFWDLETQKVP